MRIYIVILLSIFTISCKAQNETEYLTKSQIEKDYTRIAGNVAIRHQGKDSRYVLNLGAVPDKVSGWDEKYYKEAGEEYTKDNVMSKDDVLVKTRFKNLRWEGGEYIERSKTYVREKYLIPQAAEK